MFSPLVVACVVLLLVCEGQSFDPGASKALVSLRAAYPGAIGKVLKDQQGVLRARLRNGGEEILQLRHAHRVHSGRRRLQRERRGASGGNLFTTCAMFPSKAFLIISSVPGTFRKNS